MGLRVRHPARDREDSVMRRLFALFTVVTAGVAVACTRPATSAPAPAASAWVATWTASPYAAPPRPPRDSIDRTPTFVAQTLRLIVHTSIGGDRARIRLSNEYGD